jgi:transcriptional regulator with XRE-family HTH domain
MEEEKLIGQRIRAAREQRGLSQEELAVTVGVSPQSIQQWESGKTNPRHTRMRKLATVLKTSPHFLQFGIGSPESTIESTQELIFSKEFKSMVISSFSKSMTLAQTLGWIKATRSDISLAAIGDLFYNQLMEDYGLEMPTEEMEEKINENKKSP